jgi:hypothetical protein
MALEPGTLRVTVEYAKGLKASNRGCCLVPQNACFSYPVSATCSMLQDADFFGKNDPYALVSVGAQQHRTRTLKGAGTDPVWNETFSFQVINENAVEIT